jgi:tetrahydromethanopterin S-methyltransferase subunit C
MSPDIQVIIIGIIIYSLGYFASFMAFYIPIANKPRWISNVISLGTGLISGSLISYIAKYLINQG